MAKHKKSHKVTVFLISFFIIGLYFACTIGSFADKERIQAYRENPRYWEYRGKPVLLLGGSDEDNLFNNPDLMQRNLEILDVIGGNYIRGTLSCRDDGNVWPYMKSNGSYNLDNFNPEFWSRLETCIRMAEARDIIVQIEIWATFDFYRDNWLKNPYNPVNNSNYTTDNTKLVTEWDHHPAREVQPFFYSPPGLNNDLILLRYQEAFIRKILDVTLNYPNVLYCLDNETRAPAEWALYWGEFIKKETEKRGKTVHISEMWDQWDITHSEHTTTYEHPEFFSYTDVSQNNWQEGQTHYDRLIWYRNNLAGQKGGARPINNVKVYARLSGERPNDYSIGVDRWWQNIFAGCASTRFHRPPGGSGLDITAQKVIRAGRVFTSAFDIFTCEPHSELLSEREENEAYCLADPGRIYAVYFPKGGLVHLEVTTHDKDYRIQWFDPWNVSFTVVKEEEIIKESEIFGSKTHTKKRDFLPLESPDTARTWLVLIKTL